MNAFLHIVQKEKMGMSKVIENLPNVLKAVTDTYSLLALMVVVLGFVAYSTMRSSKASHMSKSWPLLVSQSIVTVALLALGLNVVRVTSGSRNDNANTLKDKYNLQATFKGVQKHSEPTQVAFRTSSGQLNVGCGDNATTSVSWNLPPNARLVNASAAWENTDNLRGQSQQAGVQGTTAIATGVISGRDREWTGNCPGGGHGELVLSGTYIIDKENGENTVSIGQFQKIVDANSTVLIPVPTSEGVAPSSLVVRASSVTQSSPGTHAPSRCSKLSLPLSIDGSGKIIAGEGLLTRFVDDSLDCGKAVAGPEITASPVHDDAASSKDCLPGACVKIVLSDSDVPTPR
jgi:hypothetical protein